jgi:chemotaxis signal transduction protein
MLNHAMIQSTLDKDMDAHNFIQGITRSAGDAYTVFLARSEHIFSSESISGAEHVQH